MSVSNEKTALLPVKIFLKKLHMSNTFLSYLEQKKEAEFKEEFDGQNPSLFTINYNGKNNIYFYVDQIPNFIKRNFLTVQLFGLKKTTAQSLLSGNLDVLQNTPVSMEKISFQTPFFTTKDERQKQ